MLSILTETFQEGGFQSSGPLGRRAERGRRGEPPNLLEDILSGYEALPAYSRQPHVRAAAHNLWKKENIVPRDLAGRASPYLDTVDKAKISSWYGCDLYHHLMYYAINYTMPWSGFPRTSPPSIDADIITQMRPSPSTWVDLLLGTTCGARLTHSSSSTYLLQSTLSRPCWTHLLG